MSAENTSNLLDWIKQHSYAIIVAVILISGDWALFNFRMDDFEKRLTSLEIEVEEIQVSRAKDMAEIKTLLLRLDNSVSDLVDGQKQRDKDIIEFYKKYNLTPKN